MGIQPMKQALEQKKRNLSRRFNKVLKTPASFDFFVAIHHFVEQVEACLPIARMKLPPNYKQLRQIYQGVEDTDAAEAGDLGHERYMVIQDLIRIRKEEVSESNPIWKKREVLRSLSVEVYETISASLR